MKQQFWHVINCIINTKILNLKFETDIHNNVRLNTSGKL